MPSNELMLAALRVLDAYTSRTYPSAADEQVLRDSAPLPECCWEIDALARHIVERELQRHGDARAAGYPS